MSVRDGTKSATIGTQPAARSASEGAQTARKLAAILSADVKGYSRLMGADEEGTLQRLTTYREVVGKVIAQHRGRVVNCAGDNILAEFASAIDALEGAWAIQHDITERNTPLPAAERMELRIGLNVGDVLVQEGQLYGDGVNIAARMEALADAGGICLTGTVYDQVYNKISLAYEYVGEQMVKNIAHPVRVYRVRMEVDREENRPGAQPALLLHFRPFQLDVNNGCLWRGKQRIPLMPKDFAVLHTLVCHAGQVVTHEELFAAVWPDTVVSHGVLKVCLLRLRRALDDATATPRFIETVHRRGYRFIAPLGTTSSVSGSTLQVSRSAEESPAQRGTWNVKRETPLVGREPELKQLHEWLDKALTTERQMVFVTGEQGIGKTTLLEAFGLGVRGWGLGMSSPLSSQTQNALVSSSLPTPNPQPLAPGGLVWWGWGQCIEHYGPGEPYLPILDALGRLCREPNGKQLVTLLQQYAPTWLVQMPALLDATEVDALQRKTAGATQGRMLRELADALEVLTLTHPLVLVLEDLHWSDLSTLDLLSFVARRKENARLLIIGTYRLVEMLSEQHPLKRLTDELYAHQFAHELRVSRLNASEVSAYIAQRFPQRVFPTRLEHVLYQRTSGHPLFLSTMVQELIHRKVLMPANDGLWSLRGEVTELETWTPESVQQVLARQHDRLAGNEQRVLEAASVAGVEFSAAAVAAALETDVTHIEDLCGRLTEQERFLRPAGFSEWPDGTRASRYGFQHALYQEFWHERVSIGHQQLWHLRMGERKEAAWRTRAGEIAAELALHFEQGGDYQRAVRYCQQAATNALRRSAYQETTNHLTKGLGLLKTLPDTPQRTQQELSLQITLGPALIATKGYTAPEVEKAYARARELCQQIEDSPGFFPVLWGLTMFYSQRAEYKTAQELAEHSLTLASKQPDPVFVLMSHIRLGVIRFSLGEFAQALAHWEYGISLYDPKHFSSYAALYGQDFGVTSLSRASQVLWFLGYADQALKKSHEAITLAQQQSHPFSLAFALSLAAECHLLRREGQAAQAQAEAVLTLALEQGFPIWLAAATMLRGWALAEQGHGEKAIVVVRQGLAVTLATGAKLGQPYYLARLAEVCGKVGQLEEGLARLGEALAIADSTGERHYEAELWRLKGELKLQQFNIRRSKSKVQSPESEAEACFQKAIAIARRQQAKSLELRAVMSLSRLWQKQSKQKEARKLLAEIYGWFTEGFETLDLREAKTLLKEIS